MINKMEKRNARSVSSQKQRRPAEDTTVIGRRQWFKAQIPGGGRKVGCIAKNLFRTALEYQNAHTQQYIVACWVQMRIWTLWESTSHARTQTNSSELDYKYICRVARLEKDRKNGNVGETTLVILTRTPLVCTKCMVMGRRQQIRYTHLRVRMDFFLRVICEGCCANAFILYMQSNLWAKSQARPESRERFIFMSIYIYIYLHTNLCSINFPVARTISTWSIRRITLY